MHAKPGSDALSQQGIQTHSAAPGEGLYRHRQQPAELHEWLRAAQPRLQCRTSSEAVAQPLSRSQPAAGHASTAIWNCPAASSSSSSSSPRHGLRLLVAEINSPVFVLMKRSPQCFLSLTINSTMRAVGPQPALPTQTPSILSPSRLLLQQTEGRGTAGTSSRHLHGPAASHELNPGAAVL